MKLFKHNGVTNIVASKQKKRTGVNLSNYQYRLYREALHGVTKRDARDMGVGSLLNCVIAAKVNNTILDNWKIDLCSNISVSKKVKLMHKYGLDYARKCSFSELGVHLEVVLDKMVLEGLLPTNFYSLR